MQAASADDGVWGAKGKVPRSRPGSQSPELAGSDVGCHERFNRGALQH